MLTLRLIVAVIVGVIGGSIINMGLVILGSAVIPPPPGVNVASAESLRAAADLLGPQHFLFPFIAHAGGTLTGCLIACWTSPRLRNVAALFTGCVFLLLGIVNAFLIPAPLWFVALDLPLAYLPMAVLALIIHRRLLEADRRNSRRNSQ